MHETKLNKLCRLKRRLTNGYEELQHSKLKASLDKVMRPRWKGSCYPVSPKRRLFATNEVLHAETSQRKINKKKKAEKKMRLLLLQQSGAKKKRRGGSDVFLTNRRKPSCGSLPWRWKRKVLRYWCFLACARAILPFAVLDVSIYAFSTASGSASSFFFSLSGKVLFKERKAG